MDQKAERNLFNPDFCESRCPICTRARKGNRLARFLQRIETSLTFGGCPWGGQTEETWRQPSEPIPSENRGPQ